MKKFKIPSLNNISMMTILKWAGIILVLMFLYKTAVKFGLIPSFGGASETENLSNEVLDAMNQVIINPADLPRGDTVYQDMADNMYMALRMEGTSFGGLWGGIMAAMNSYTGPECLRVRQLFGVREAGGTWVTNGEMLELGAFAKYYMSDDDFNDFSQWWKTKTGKAL